MANGTDFDGSNAKYGPPPGVSEDQCKTLHVFKNGHCIVSAWDLTAEELAEIVRTRRVFSSTWSGETLYPQFIGSESSVHAVVADFGKVWKLSEQPKEQEQWDLRKGVKTVIDNFKASENAGYRSKDRQYAIEILSKYLDNS